MRILITGSRDYDNEYLIRKWLNKVTTLEMYIKDPNHVVVHGSATGADTIAGTIAKSNGWEVEEHPADWEGLGKRAGYVRNAEMAKLGADVCLAFRNKENSVGTNMMMRLAKDQGIPVIDVEKIENDMVA